jgi:hypothetical protein
MNAMMAKAGGDAAPPRPWREIRELYTDSVDAQFIAPGGTRAVNHSRVDRGFCQGPCTLTGAFANLCARCPKNR